MEPDKPSIDSIFLAAIELPEKQRPTYLDDVCGPDVELRARVQRLLSAQSKAASFLESPAPELNPTEAVPLAERPGTKIGPYKLLQQIGEGGFGIVYMAEQTEPVRRRVALKIIKPGMDTKEVIARFEAERQALAMMDHPNIARVLDAGATESGRPFFVMELVKGPPVTDFCDQNRLTVRERLALFTLVCQAVQHAHQKGVIHRDIKPSNVLVCLYDGHPMPKVIDFGVAKAIEQPLVQRTLFTQFGQIIGTLEYMSPEQAELNQLDVDTRSDIYSLGVLLYELFTGTTPLSREQLREAAFAETLRMIREADPERPSVRLSHSGDALAKISAQRRTDPDRLPRLLSGELDWIVIKALEKDRLRRYATAADLARDVQRHLNDEPVEACPPSLSYRMRKVVRRHRAALATAAMFLLLLVAGAVFSTWQAIRAIRAEQQAVLALERAYVARRTAQMERDRSAQAEREAIAEREKAVKAEANARKDRDAAEDAQAKESAARQIAETDRQAKTRALRRAEGLRLTAQSSAVLATNPGLALLLAIEGARHGPRRAVHNNALMAALSECREERTFRHESDVYLAAISPDSKRLLCCFRYWAGPPLNTDDHMVCVWDIETGKPVAEFAGHHLKIGSASFSPDGKRIVFTYDDQQSELQFRSGAIRIYTNRVARIWDVATGKETAVLRGHKERVLSAAFSPDGTRILTASYDGARIWNATTGKELLVIPADKSSLLAAGFLGDGERVFTAPSGDRYQGHYAGLDAPDNTLVDPAAGVVPPRIKATDVLQGISTGGGMVSSSVGMPHVFSVWDSASGRLVSHVDVPSFPWPFEGGASFNRTQCLAVSPDGQRLFTSGVLANAVLGGSRPVIWSVHEGKAIAKLRCDGIIRTACFSPGGKWLLTVSHGHDVTVWDAASGDELIGLHGHEGAVSSARFSHDGRMIVTASEDKTARVWDATSGRQIAVLRGHEQSVSWAAFTSDGLRVATASVDGTARVWQVRDTSKHSILLTGHAGPVNMISFAPDGRRAATASDDRTVRIWDLNTGRVLSVLAATRSRVEQSSSLDQDRIFGPVRYASFSPDGRSVLSVGTDRIVRIRHLRNDAPQDVVEREEVIFTPARLWDAGTGHQMRGFEGSRNAVHWAVFSPDGRRVLTVENAQFNESPLDLRNDRLVSRGERSGGDSDRETFARIYDTTSGKQVLALPHVGAIISGEFSPDGQRILTAYRRSDTGPYAVIWDANTGKRLMELGHVQTNVGWAVFSPDGRRVLTMDMLGARLWDATSGRQLRELKGVADFAGGSVERAIPCRPFSPDGRRLILPLRSPHGALAVWDAASGKQTVRLTGHRGAILSAQFSPDGKRIVTASGDETARIWDAETGTEWLTLSGSRGPVRYATFNPDGSRVGTASADGTARIWSVDPLPAAVARKPRELTAEERTRFEAQPVTAEQGEE